MVSEEHLKVAAAVPERVFAELKIGPEPYSHSLGKLRGFGLYMQALIIYFYKKQ